MRQFGRGLLIDATLKASTQVVVRTGTGTGGVQWLIAWWYCSFEFHDQEHPPPPRPHPQERQAEGRGNHSRQDFKKKKKKAGKEMSAMRVQWHTQAKANRPSTRTTVDVVDDAQITSAIYLCYHATCTYGERHPSKGFAFPLLFSSTPSFAAVLPEVASMHTEVRRGTDRIRTPRALGVFHLLVCRYHSSSVTLHRAPSTICRSLGKRTPQGPGRRRLIITGFPSSDNSRLQRERQVHGVVLTRMRTAVSESKGR